ncbi:MAG: carboxypeptidase-like regulatory domain-containing protein [Gemmatimonadota bacterium]|nr:carboxypeptidase-like regulatory domain-containing protein [Gemmatimonadota bacterium]MDE3012614.1 carboxypeptidase-like regulatory domain-containing protein [Gemmatimonadota bacterium]
MIRSSRLLFAVTAALLAGPASVCAQTVLVRVIDDDGGRPMVGAVASLMNPAGQLVTNTLTDERGRALFTEIPLGTYTVRAEMIGKSTAETDAFEITENSTVSRDLMLESSAIILEGIEVAADAGRCQVRPGGEGLLVAAVWEEARKALSAASITDQVGAYRYELMSYDRQLDRQSGTVLSEEQRRQEGYMTTPFESRPAEDLIENGFVQRDGRDFLYYAPDASVLLSDAFLDTHCFKMVASRNEEGLVGLGFEPTGDEKSVPDIQGTMWLHPETAELQWLEYQYAYLEAEMTSELVGGRVDFEKMPNGTWIVPEWWIRMPIMENQTGFDRRVRSYIAQYHQTGGLVLEVREAGGRSLGQRAETGGIEGIVRDSLGVPKRGVRIGVVGSNQEVYSNAEGAYSITGLTAGRYQVRFIDAQLEDMGYIPNPVERDVIRGEMAFLEFFTPSMGDVLLEACEGVERERGSVLLAGSVIDRRDRPVANAQVQITWEGYSAAGGGNLERIRDLTESTSGFSTVTNQSGFFKFCGVPAGRRLTLQANVENARSDEVGLTIPGGQTGRMTVLTINAR